MDWMVSAGLRPPILSSFCSLSTQGPHGFVRRYEWMLRERERWRRREERRRLLLFIFGDNKEVLMREWCVCVFNLRGDDLFSGEWGEEHEECGGRWKRNARNRRRGEKRPTYNKISWPKKTCCFLAILPTLPHNSSLHGNSIYESKHIHVKKLSTIPTHIWTSL